MARRLSLASATRGLAAPLPTDSFRLSGRIVNEFATREREVRDTLWLLCAIVWVLAPLAGAIPIWTSIAIGALLLWRGILTWSGRRLPPRWLVAALMLAAGTAVFAQFHSIFGKDAGVAYVVLLLGLKLLELKARRDTFVVIFLCLFIMLTSLFDSQSLAQALWLFVGVLWLVTALVRMNLLGREPPLRAKVTLALQITLLALPLTIVVFIFFPRVEGPLWGMPADAYSSAPGLSDSMKPGDMEELVTSDRLAFEVDFDGRIPAANQRYWRGPVLGRYDGTTWRPMPTLGAAQSTPLDLEGDEASTARYTVTQEPTNRNALYLLDAPVEVPRVHGLTARLKPDLEVALQGPLRERVRFDARSYTRFHYGLNASLLERREWVELPPHRNPHTLEFATRLRHEFPDDRKLIQHVLNYIRTENFEYATKGIPKLGENATDDFLFVTKRGFCEHYASAFVVLMRAADIPARVVTGYQGGDINPINGSMTIRQKDAHAWAEVWLADTGWTRFDPTAAVAPERIMLGSEETLAQTDGIAGTFRGLGTSWVRWIGYNLEVVNNTWNQWVVAYSDDSQRTLFSRLGMPEVDWSTLTIALIAASALVLAVVGGQVLMKRPRTEPIMGLYARLCERAAKLAKGGEPRRPTEGPRDYLARIAMHLPEPERGQIERGFALYEELRYAHRTPSADGLAALRRCIRSLGA